MAADEFGDDDDEEEEEGEEGEEAGAYTRPLLSST